MTPSDCIMTAKESRRNLAIGDEQTSDFRTKRIQR